MRRSMQIFKILGIYLTAVLIIAPLFTACSIDDKADLVLINATVITVDDTKPEAEAVAVKGDTIFAVGTTEEIKEMIGDATQVIDLEGATVIPGFIESHAHFLSVGKAKTHIDLRYANNWDEIVYEVLRASENIKPGEWILGRGWHQEKWESAPDPNVEGYPYHTILSNAVPLNPVVLTHASGHAILVNAKAMELAGINENTPNPDGGRIVRDSLGIALGIFEENAENLILDKYDEAMANRTEQMVKDEIKNYIRLADEECLAKGITTVYDAGTPLDTIDIIKEVVDEEMLGIRLNVMISDTNKKLKERIKDYRFIGYGNDHLTVRAIKKFIDGALGSRGAWMLEEYSDLPGHTGLNTDPIYEMRETADIAIANGFQLCTHAIGDKGNRETLNVYERAFKSNLDKTDLRWRIEHAQHLSARDIPRFAELGIIPSMQSCHCTSDAPYVVKRLGEERAETGAYVWRKLMNTGAIICNGTDAPVEDIDPIKNYYAAVTRKTADGLEFYPDQKMTREEALKSYTINGAYAAFQENIKGSITPGKLADFTVLSQDITTVPDEEIINTEIVYTIVGGKVLYDRNGE